MGFGAMCALLAGVSLLASPAAAATHGHHKATKHVAADPNRPPASARPIYESIVIDANTGRVLHQVNADTQAYPASLTKMMTLYMLFDALQKGKVRLDTPMKVSQKAAAQAPSKLDLTPGSTIAVEQAIYAIVTKSANDVAVVIAEHLGGSEEHFATMMTARAHAIGMTRTQFKNASGLPNKGQLSTARDMAILGKRLMTEFPTQFAYFSKTEFPYRGVLVKGHNHLLDNYDGADGIKTGYTAASGFNLVGSARRGDQRLITVVFGGASAKIRDDHVAALMDAGFGVLAHKPEAVAVAQAVDPFPSLPEPAAPVAAEVATAGSAETPSAGAPVQLAAASAASTDVEPPASAGDIDDAIGRQIATDAPAPPLAETAALVPAPGSLNAKGKAAAMRAAALKAEARSDAKRAMAPAAPTSSWGIQIGAFANRLLAETQATAAAGRIKATFAGAAPRVVPVTVKHHHTLYRAQVVGLSKQDTTKACVLARKEAQAGCKAVAPDQKTVAMR